MKNFSMKYENGRSMIEMLGVLAIIGVLSVGGIAGYSKAMMRYRVNKTIEQFTLIAGNMRTFFKGNYSDLAPGGNTIFRKAKIVPDEMWDGDYIKNVFGESLIIERADKANYQDYKAFNFNTYFPKGQEEACIEVVSQDWTGVGVVSIALQGPPSVFKKIPLSLDDAIAVCYTSEEIHIRFLFDADEKCNTENNAVGFGCS